MKKYKVPFTGFAYVEAESEAEALEYARDGNTIYEEQEWEDAKEVSEFFVDGMCLRNGMDD
jgi:hypothetical protein